MASSASTNFEEQQTSRFNKLDLLWLVITVLVFSGLVKLGFWQSSRALEKEQRLTRIEQLKQQQAISVEQVLAISVTENINDYPVLLEGTFAQGVVFLLDNQIDAGRLGYRVLQVLQTNDHTVLVNLGWIAGSINRDEIPKIVSLKGKHQFIGHVRLPELGIQLMEQNFSQPQWPLRVQQLELDKFSALINQELLPFVIYVDKDESIGFKKNWQPIVMPPEKHRGYAFQWFSLAAAWLLLMCWAKFGHNKKKNLLLMLFAFALPVILAKLALEFQWLDLGVTNKGTLLSEELTLEQLGLNDAELEGQWLILYNLPEQCGEYCEKAMETVHNTYVALGKEMPRITPVALYQQFFSNKQMQQLSKSQWRLLAMPIETKQSVEQSQIFIVDPLGNVFLSHKLPTEHTQLPQFGKQIMADMKKLLKYSKVG